jgi:hypothetical protein
MLLVNYLSDGFWRAGIEDRSLILDAAAVHGFGAAAPTVRELLRSGQDEVAATLARAADNFQSGDSSLRPLAEARLLVLADPSRARLSASSSPTATSAWSARTGSCCASSP